MKRFLHIVTAATLAALVAAAPALAQDGASVPAAASGQTALAQAATGSLAVLDRDAVRALVLAASASLRKAELARDSAALAEDAQRYKMLPSLSAQAGGSFDLAGGGSLTDRLGASLKVSASQTLYDGGKQAAQVQSAGVTLATASQALTEKRVSLIGQADAAYLGVLKAESSLQVALADLEASSLRLRLARARAEAGVIPQADYMQAESDAASDEAALAKARKALASARAKLASLAGLSQMPALVPLDFSRYEELVRGLVALDEAGIAATSLRLLELAAGTNLGLASQALAVKKAELSLKQAGSAYVPSVQAGLSQSLGWSADRGFSLGAGSVSVSASMSLDLWTSANGVASARLGLESASLEQSEAARTLALDLDLAFNALLSAAGSISALDKALLYAENSYRNVLEKYKLSTASASELATAEAQLSASRAGHSNARYDFLSAISELRALVGLEDEGRVLAVLP